jgi:hypothetical protein
MQYGKTLPKYIADEFLWTVYGILEGNLTKSLQKSPNL